MKRAAWVLMVLLFGIGGAWLWLVGLAPVGRAEDLAVPVIPSAPDITRLQPAVLKAFLETSPTDSLPVIVEYARDPTFLTQLDLPDDEVAARETLIAALQAQAALAARPVMDAIARSPGASNVRLFWISPVIALEAPRELIAELSRMDAVLQIRPDLPIRLPRFEPQPVDLSSGAPITDLPWNLRLIGLDLVQPGLQLDGSGVVVANLDTGVDWLHPALFTRYRGYDPAGNHEHEGNWHVSTGESIPAPADALGHGTHTMGIQVGQAAAGPQVGVAPGAVWIAVKMINNQGYFLESWAHDAFEWILAPEGDPALAPDVVSSSWGTSYNIDPRFRPDIIALRLGNILPIFSAGNDGPFESTVASPADYPESFAVGAVDDAALVTTFSGRGPSGSPWSEIKPELAAPGADVLSTFPGGAYALGDGTSMAAPHAAGVAALLLQAAPGLTPDELEALLLQTARPLAPPTPNNDTGWGLLNAYAAAVAVTPHGTIAGVVADEYGVPLPYAVITATQTASSLRVVVAGEADGAFEVHLAPGLYKLSAAAFAYEPAQAGFVQVLDGGQVLLDFALVRRPVGAVYGRVLDLVSGAPLSATLEISGAGFKVQTNPLGGYALHLPQGAWQLEVRSPAHRIVHQVLTVTVGLTEALDIPLTPAPSILLVDSGRWYYNSKIGYFEAALDALDYYYTVRDVRDPYGILTGDEDRLLLEDLAPYNLVIWSAPLDSPGLIRSGNAISDYLSLGGKLIISGEDVAFWDGGANLFVYPDYFPYYGGGKFLSELPHAEAVGIPGTMLEGLSVLVNGPGSDGGQMEPDTVFVVDAFVAQPGMSWEDGGTAALLSGGCMPYRLAWTGFGFEGVGPTSDRLALIGRLLDWSARPPPEKGIAVDPIPQPLIAAPGGQLTRTLTLHNTGTQPAGFILGFSGHRWPVLGILPDGTTFTETAVLGVPACASEEIEAVFTVPEGLPYDVFDRLVLTAQHRSDPEVADAVTLTVKTPAPILLLDDGLWTWYGGRYSAALEDLGLAHDLVSTEGRTLAENLLLDYPLVIWTTGQDWFYSIQPSEEVMIQDYLTGGGRLLISSQDLLNVAGASVLARDYLGVDRYATEITPTVAAAVSNALFPGPAQAWRLTYPFVNWSDGLEAVVGADVIMRDAAAAGLGVAHIPAAAPAARSLFYAFPLEALSPAGLQQVLGDSLLWLGPFGGSSLSVAEIAPSGTTIPLTLTLRLAQSESAHDWGAAVRLPAGVEVDPGSVAGGWRYDPPEHALIWQGDLRPDLPLTLTAAVEIDSGLAPATGLPFTVQLNTDDLQRFAVSRVVWVDAPRLVVENEVAPAAVDPAAPVVTYTLRAFNAGFGPGAAVLTDTLPAPLTLLTDTLKASTGVVTAAEGRILWNGSLTAGEEAVITFQAGLIFPQPLGWLVNFVEAWDGAALRFDWAPLFVPGSLYFPLIGR